MSDTDDVTQLLHRLSSGDESALDDLVPHVYGELKQLAHHRLRGERRGHTLNTTALVNEAYMRLVDINRVDWQDRKHFLTVAARVMRRILIDYALKRTAQKRGGKRDRMDLEDAMLMTAPYAQELIDLNDALSELEQLDPRQSRIIELRYFGGLQVDEVAAVLDVSERTVKRDTRTARAWLAMRLGGRSEEL